MTSDELAPVPYEYAAVASSGAIVFTAGACPLDASGSVSVGADHGAQADVAVTNLLAVLARYGAGPEDLLRTTIYVVGNRDDLAEVWQTVSVDWRPIGLRARFWE